jgi:hypothetical protein
LIRNVPEPLRQFLMRPRKSAGSASGGTSRVYSSFGLTLEATYFARTVSPVSRITPTARSRSTITSRTPASSTSSTPWPRAAFAIAWVIAPMPPMAWPQTPFLPFTSPNA